MQKRAHIKKAWAELDEEKYTEAERLERIGKAPEEGV